VHGIGSQRRYEETSRLVDRLDTYAGNEHRRGHSLGRLVNIKARIEPLTTGAPDDTITYIRTALLPPRAPGTAQVQPSETVRFYEVYWAPIMAGAKSPVGVIRWVFKQAWRPLTTLRTPWRERQRLRRSALVSLFKPGVTPPAAAQDGDYDRLVVNYAEFEGLSAQREFPDGTFSDYLAFIAARFRNQAETATRLQQLARIWRRTYWLLEFRNVFALASLALALILLGGGTIALALLLLKALLGWSVFGALATRFGLEVEASIPTAFAMVTTLAMFLGLGKLLTDYLGDVEAWSTYEETDEKHIARGKVMNEAITTISHVLNDPRCGRAIVVAHSLGTSIAHDALLAITRRNRATNSSDPIEGPVPLDKIEHFVTLGSPIDKIEYFFESYASASHRYKRVIEELRGDVGTPPFSRNRKPFVHWVNYWDLGDPVSGSLDSPASASRSAQFIDNVAVASFGFPFPAASHAGYFDHAGVIADIFGMIFQRKWSLRALASSGTNQPLDYRSAFLGPGELGAGRIAFLLLAAALPWLALALIAALLLGGQAVSLGIAALLIADLVALLLGLLINSVRKHRHPL
jgi:hypothetical protein